MCVSSSLKESLILHKSNSSQIVQKVNKENFTEYSSSRDSVSSEPLELNELSPSYHTFTMIRSNSNLTTSDGQFLKCVLTKQNENIMGLALYSSQS